MPRCLDGGQRRCALTLLHPRHPAVQSIAAHMLVQLRKLRDTVKPQALQNR
jgi:hypothetical protein